MTPPGTNLTLDQLLVALEWKLHNQNHGGTSFEIADISDAQRITYASTAWSQRVLKSKCLTSLFQHNLNAQAPVSILPCEVLGEVFLYLRSNYSTTPFQLPPEKYDLNDANSWIKATHVCQRWWLCAKSTKALWCRIALGNRLKSPANLARSFLQLSDPLPITLEQELGQLSRGEDGQMKYFYRLLLACSSRISSLYLRGHLPDMARDLLRLPLPNIAGVELISEKGEPEVDAWEISPRRRLVQYVDTSRFLGGNSSSLRKLSLKCYTWPDIACPALTHLYLSSELYKGFFEHDFFQILASLSFTLQVLYLRDHGPSVNAPCQYRIRCKADRTIMHALTHLELHPPGFKFFQNFMLMYLHNLALPKIEKIVWECALTRDINRLGMWAVPPGEHLERVTRLVGWETRRKDCYVLDGNTIYFDALQVTSSVLAAWKTLLPNIVTSQYVEATPDVLKRWTLQPSHGAFSG